MQLIPVSQVIPWAVICLVKVLQSSKCHACKAAYCCSFCEFPCLLCSDVRVKRPIRVGVAHERHQRCLSNDGKANPEME